MLYDASPFLPSILPSYCILFSLSLFQREITDGLASLSPFRDSDNQTLITSLKTSVYSMFAYSVCVGFTHATVTFIVFSLAGTYLSFYILSMDTLPLIISLP